MTKSRPAVWQTKIYYQQTSRNDNPATMNDPSYTGLYTNSSPTFALSYFWPALCIPGSDNLKIDELYIFQEIYIRQLKWTSETQKLSQTKTWSPKTKRSNTPFKPPLRIKTHYDVSVCFSYTLLAHKQS